MNSCGVGPSDNMLYPYRLRVSWAKNNMSWESRRGPKERTKSKRRSLLPRHTQTASQA